jgi:hypothetical protein
MNRLIASAFVLCATTATTTAFQGSPTVYAPVSSVDAKVDGRMLGSLAFDAKANRLYAGSDRGLFWVNVADAKPVWHGPAFKMHITHIEFAPELGRVVFATLDDGVGYVATDALGEPKIIADVRASDLAYEPSRREIYVTSRASRVEVFDGATGERGAVVDLPGWVGAGLEAVPGRVFLMQAKTPGIFMIDAKTHALSPFVTSESVTTPVHLEADPSGRFIFAAYYQNIVAINAMTGTVVGRATTDYTPAIAFDPGTNLLVATAQQDLSDIKVVVYRVDADGLSEVSHFKNPSAGLVGVEPTSRGFIQRGMNRFYIWSARGN